MLQEEESLKLEISELEETITSQKQQLVTLDEVLQQYSQHLQEQQQQLTLAKVSGACSPNISS